jgi:multicomponent K+:H+ antiporter subunit D
LVAAALFLLVDRIAQSRISGDQMDGSAWSVSPTQLGVVFFVFSVSVAGMPPLAGFLGKAQLLQAAATAPYPAASWSAILLSSLAIIFTLARAGSSLFWKAPVDLGCGPPVTPAATGERVALALLMAALVGVAIAAGPLASYTQAAAVQLTERRAYVDAVLGAQPAPAAWNVREGMVKP